jgi:hypothetical protein
MLKAIVRPVILVLLVSLAACGPKNPNAPGKVSGVVTYKGEILKSGNVTFHVGEQKTGYNAAIDTDGKYQAFDLPTGTHVVTIETESLNPDRKVPTYGARQGKGKGGMSEQAAMMGAPDPKMLAERFRAIPKKYADPKTSGLSVTIKQGVQTVNFDLVD